MEAQAISPVKAADAHKRANVASGMGDLFQAMLRESAPREESREPNRRTTVSPDPGPRSSARGASEPSREAETRRARRADEPNEARGQAPVRDRGDEANADETGVAEPPTESRNEKTARAEPTERRQAGNSPDNPGANEAEDPTQAMDGTVLAAPADPQGDDTPMAVPGAAADTIEPIVTKSTAKPTPPGTQSTGTAGPQFDDVAAGAQQKAAGPGKASAKVVPAAVVSAPPNALGGTAASLALADAGAAESSGPSTAASASIDPAQQANVKAAAGGGEAPGLAAAKRPDGAVAVGDGAASDSGKQTVSERSTSPSLAAAQNSDAARDTARDSSAARNTIVKPTAPVPDGLAPGSDNAAQIKGGGAALAAKDLAAQTAQTGPGQTATNTATAIALDSRTQDRQATAATGTATPAAPLEPTLPQVESQGRGTARGGDLAADPGRQAAPAPAPNTGTAPISGAPVNNTADQGSAASKAELATTPGENPANGLKANVGPAISALANDGGAIQSARAGDGAAQPQVPQFDLGRGQAAARTDSVQTALTQSAPGRGVAVDEIAVRIQRAVAQGEDRIRIRLHPAELGQIDVKLKLAADGAVRAVVAVDRPETFDLMQRDSRGLERALQDAGLKTDSGSLSFNLRGEGQGDLNARRDQTQSAGVPEAADTQAGLDDAQAPASPRLDSNRALDIRV